MRAGRKRNEPVFHVGEQAIRVPASTASALANVPAVQLGIYPEHVVLSDAGRDPEVLLVQPVGTVPFVTLGWAGGRLTARVPGMSSLHSGAHVRFTVDPGHLMFLEESGRCVPTSV